MLKLQPKKQDKFSNSQKPLCLSDIEKYYLNHNKTSLIGLEYERLSLDKNTLENAPYEKLEKIISSFCDITSWKPIYDQNTLIGAQALNSSSTISLEPGCQLEISLAPKNDILSIDYEANKIITLLDKIALSYDVIFLGYGISPVSCVDDIKLLNKRRYLVMNDYLPYCPYGEFAPKMMRQSAGIQVNVDYEDSKDAYYKLKFFNLIMPFICALGANSPLENNCLSDKKTIRANVWRYTGSERCNLFYKKLFDFPNAKNNTFKSYIASVVDVPMIFIERENKIIEINGKITFREFMKDGFEGYFATLNDYILHQSLCFPDVRLKKYIEIRNHDSSDIKTALSFCALYKGLLNYGIKKALDEIPQIKTDEICNYNKEIISLGLDVKIDNKTCGWDIIASLFNMAKSSLCARERSYLEPILNMLKTRKTKADLIIDYDIKNARELVEFLS